jgi:hypothetical protein
MVWVKVSHMLLHPNYNARPLFVNTNNKPKHKERDGTTNRIQVTNGGSGERHEEKR